MTKHEQQVLVIGYGNALRGDDGAGLAVVAAIEALGLPTVSTRTAQQLTPEMAETISGFERVFFVDASVELAVGEVRWQAVAAAESEATSLGHQMGPAALLAWCKGLYPRNVPEATVLGIGVGNLAVGEGLSPAVGKAVEKAARELARRLKVAARPTERGRA